MKDYFKINTHRLTLRKLEQSNVQAFFAYRSNAEANKYQGWIPKTEEDAEDFIGNRIHPEINVVGTWFQVGIFLKEPQQLIGDIGLHFFEEQQVELGITLNKEYQGCGFAVEALREIVGFLFAELEKHRLTASIDPENEKSIRLFERSGFRKEAHFKKSILLNGQWVDDVVFGLLKEEWGK